MRILFVFMLLTFGSASLAAQVVSLQSDRLNFNYRVNEAADISGGNLDFSYRGVDYGFSEAWLISTAGSTTELTGGTVVDGADTGSDEKIWTVNEGDLSFRVNFFAFNEFEVGPHSGVMLAMNVALLNNSTTETLSGTLLNYSDMNIGGLGNASPENGSLVAATSQDDTTLFTTREDALGLAAWSAKRWNAVPLVGGTSSGQPSSGWAMDSLASNLLTRLRSGTLLGNAMTPDLLSSDITGAAQWDFNLAPQTGISIQSDLSVFVRAVPEPGLAGLWGLAGLLGLVSRRRI